MEDLKKFGLCADFRRSFITTSVNPYYDSFVRWQFLKLKEAGRVKFGKRPSIFSPLDGQICADHDRASGEGVIPQAYTCIKIKVLELKGKLAELQGKDVFLVAATLRPETMYGQTNCFVLPGAEYGAFQMANAPLQHIIAGAFFKETGVVEKLFSVTGDELIGLPLKAPNAV